MSTINNATLETPTGVVVTSNQDITIDFSLIELLPNGRVSARKLYKFLELRHADVSRWLDSKIVNNDFAIENEDYWGFRIVAEGN
ncbi:MAG: antA/AntB antirepressor family protein, partial [Fusobacteriaceae bacterium]